MGVISWDYEPVGPKARPVEPPAVVPFFEFVSGPFTRKAWYKGERRRPSKATIWLDGGNEAIGTTILGQVNPGLGELYLAPDGLPMIDGTSTWIKSWTPDPSVLPSGADGDTDLTMLADLVAEIHTRWPSVLRIYVAGHSGGGGMVEEQACRGDQSLFNGYCVFKRPLHESQVDNGVAILAEPRRPLLLWLSNTDFEHNDAPDHVGLEGTVEAYVAGYETLSVEQSVQRLGGYELIRNTYDVPTGEAPFTYIEQQGGGHAWVDGIDSIARNFFRTALIT